MSLGKYCSVCKKDSKEYRKPVCKKMVNDETAKCTKFDLDKVVTSLGELKNLHGDTKSYTKRALKTSNGKLYLKGGKIYFHGEDRETEGLKVDFELKKENDVWSLLDPKKVGGKGWIPFSDYLTTSLYEQTLKEQKEMKSISDKIEEKLRDIYFYTVSEKGKERVTFDLEDKRNIEQHLKDLYNQNIVGDRGFIMAVVRAKGSDKEDGQLIKLGSFPKDSNIDLGFEEKGLGSLVGTQYFSIKNNDGPDDRDFEIVRGDINKDIEFKKEVEDTNYKQTKVNSSEFTESFNVWKKQN